MKRLNIFNWASALLTVAAAGHYLFLRGAPSLELKASLWRATWASKPSLNMLCLFTALAGAFFLLHRWPDQQTEGLARRIVVCAWLTTILGASPLQNAELILLPWSLALWLLQMACFCAHWFSNKES